ncbi:stalk domain-containing protein [Brevibacillus brevis]|uniref:Proteinase inhibitor I42 chagasin domain-containing protein n=1 Tax=Brevibacillus brevis TaxID=1393 RepID=A0A517I597_BREBE|nr:protease inhibitor I42 family protein [Brevibacillus brevis]QDS34073.1 hypothetical protein FPS98_08825 [Brevibacillus brevis]
MNNKLVVSIVGTALISTTLFGQAVGKTLPIRVSVNNQVLNIDQYTVYKQNGHTMIPLRVLSESLGYSLKWDGLKRMVEVKKGDQSFSITMGKDSYVNEQAVSLSLGAVPEQVESHMYVPLEFFRDVMRINITEQQEHIMLITPESSGESSNLKGIPLQENGITTVKQGDHVRVSLEENPSTGYLWSYQASDDTIKLMEVTVQKKNGEAIGAPTQKTWVFQPSKTGTYKLTFTLSRAMEQSPPKRVYTITVR